MMWINGRFSRESRQASLEEDKFFCVSHMSQLLASLSPTLLPLCAFPRLQIEEQ